MMGMLLLVFLTGCGGAKLVELLVFLLLLGNIVLMHMMKYRRVFLYLTWTHVNDESNERNMAALLGFTLKRF
jgi:hypothetical protein